MLCPSCKKGINSAENVNPKPSSGKTAVESREKPREWCISLMSFALHLLPEPVTRIRRRDGNRPDLEPRRTAGGLQGAGMVQWVCKPCG